jgi:hypothetical protein
MKPRVCRWSERGESGGWQEVCSTPLTTASAYCKHHMHILRTRAVSWSEWHRQAKKEPKE